MIKIASIGILIVIFLKCTNQPDSVGNNSDKIEIDEYLAYFNKPALDIQVKDKIIYIHDSSNTGVDRIKVVGVHWPKRDSSMLDDSVWTSCHASPKKTCRRNFEFTHQDTAGRFQYPEYLCIEYLYKNNAVFDTIFLDSIAHFCSNMFLEPIYSFSRITGYNLLWRSEIINNSSVELKNMTIQMNSSASFRGETYYSIPNVWNEPFKNGEPNIGFTNWYSAFSPNDNYFSFSAGSGAPVVWIEMNVKSYPEYDIRMTAFVYFL